ncbi:hypothetical protein [Christiangramia aestuarii]|uniref:Uncharacterized protein n=1 Tax=Christiangramia aestuarii TaxID=1028746 RepID=A0A7K1LQ39_9FLAO|nr:hypothetical protein [Christiangramia aestuarii]MUP42883.1 hypothetical protein [Christiangramia aestuarii]
MLKQTDFIFTTEEDYKRIQLIKDRIQNIHTSPKFFGLPLKTLELIRRFNSLYLQVIDQNDSKPSNMNQLMITTRGLESELF